MVEGQVPSASDTTSGCALLGSLCFRPWPDSAGVAGRLWHRPARATPCAAVWRHLPAARCSLSHWISTSAPSHTNGGNSGGAGAGAGTRGQPPRTPCSRGWLVDQARGPARPQGLELVCALRARGREDLGKEAFTPSLVTERDTCGCQRGGERTQQSCLRGPGVPRCTGGTLTPVRWWPQARSPEGGAPDGLGARVESRGARTLPPGGTRRL